MEKKTPLYDVHVEEGGKIVPFAGYLLPVQYGTGVIKEHMAVREQCGLFDVSHMGEVLFTGPTALDTLNHLTDYKDFCKAIARAALFLHPDGVFVFDLNTPFKHREILADNAFLYDYDDVFCAWQNTLLEDDVVQMDLTIFADTGRGRYRRMEESFAERAYSLDQVREALRRAGLVLTGFYGEDSTEAPAPDAQRWIFVARHAGKEDAPHGQ